MHQLRADRNLLEAQDRNTEALDAYQKELVVAQRLVELDATNGDWLRILSVNYQNIGNVLKKQDKYAEALDAYRNMLTVTEKLTAINPRNPWWQRDLWVAHLKIAGALAKQDDYADARATSLKALAIMQRVADGDPRNPQWQKDLSVSNDSACWTGVMVGQLEAALAYCNEALRLQPDYANARSNRGFAYLKMGRFDQAIPDYDAALQQDAKDADALYGRGLAKLQSGDKGGGETDIAAASAIKADVAAFFARHGLQPATARAAQQ